MWQPAPHNVANWGNQIWAQSSSPVLQQTYHQPVRGFPGGGPKYGRSGHAIYGNGKKHNNRQKPTELVGYCDVCDRGFKTEVQQKEHFEQHTKCSEDGCKFEAHFKVVAIHKKNVHGSRRINIQLETPEEIQAWREERKRRYPTAQNKDLKAKQDKDRHETGNVLQTKTFGKMRKFNKRRKQETDVPCLNDQALSSQQNIKTASLNLLESASVCCNDEGSDADEEPQLSIKVNITGALGSLMDAYESDSGDESKTVTDLPATKKSVSPQRNTCPVKSSPPQGDRPKAMNVPAAQNKSTAKHQKKNSRKPQQRPHKVSAHRKNLLEMLLAPDIRRERNVILQCVRYIVENNFFDNTITG